MPPQISSVFIHFLSSGAVTPFRRVNRPEELAEALFWLACFSNEPVVVPTSVLFELPEGFEPVKKMLCALGGTGLLYTTSIYGDDYDRLFASKDQYLGYKAEHPIYFDEWSDKRLHQLPQTLLKTGSNTRFVRAAFEAWTGHDSPEGWYAKAIIADPENVSFRRPYFQRIAEGERARGLVEWGAKVGHLAYVRSHMEEFDAGILTGVKPFAWLDPELGYWPELDLNLLATIGSRMFAQTRANRQLGEEILMQRFVDPGFERFVATFRAVVRKLWRMALRGNPATARPRLYASVARLGEAIEAAGPRAREFTDLAEQLGVAVGASGLAEEVIGRSHPMMPPRVFISYCHEPGIEKWVYRLTEFLRTNGVDATYDQILRGKGTVDFDDLMVEEIESADYIIVVLTPRYKKRIKDKDSGVGVEYRLIRSDLLRRKLGRYVFILRSGDFETASPQEIMSIDKHDFRAEDLGHETEVMRDLLRQLRGVERLKVSPARWMKPPKPRKPI